MRRVYTLCFDIGGTGLKARVFDGRARPCSERVKVETPHKLQPPAALAIFRKMSAQMPKFDQISAGFPGVVKDGKTWTATHLGPAWVGYDLQAALERALARPARVANDADVQGLAVIGGKGVEMVLTLGTGFGSALFHQGILIPNLQLSHQTFSKNETYEDIFGIAGLERSGNNHWNRKLRAAIAVLEQVFNWDRLYIGGGNARKIDGQLPRNVRIVSNENGLKGGVKLWKLPGIHMEKDRRSLVRAVRDKVAA